MVRLSEKAINDLQVLEKFYGEWSFYRDADIMGLEVIDSVNHPKTVYYAGPYFDFTPVIGLDSGQDYYYQERHEIARPIKSALEVLQENGIVTGLKEMHHVGKGTYHPEFKFSVNGRQKNLHIFENSDILQGAIPEVSEADLIYGYNSLVTDEMLQKAKPGVLILDHPGAGGDDFCINERQIKKYNLTQVVYPHSDKSIFNWSHFYTKR